LTAHDVRCRLLDRATQLVIRDSADYEFQFVGQARQWSHADAFGLGWQGLFERLDLPAQL
jgi:hypothetical protein